jgi:MFS family permease
MRISDDKGISSRDRAALGACMLIPSISYGVASSSFPLWVVPWMADFHIRRSTAMIAFALGNLVMGLLSPIVGQVLARAPARLSVTVGGVVLALGFLLGSFVHQFWEMISLYATLVAVGTAFTGLLPAQSVAVSIVPHKAGTMSGVITVAIAAGAIVLPGVFNALVAALGWRSAFLIAAIIVLSVIAPIGWFLLRGFGNVVPEARGAASDSATGGRGLELRALLGNLAFWVPLMAVVPAMFLSGTILTNAVAIAADNGIALATAGYLVPAIAAGGAAGSIGLGWLCDRLDCRWVFSITAVVCTVAVLFLLCRPGPLPMALSFFVVGMVAGGVFPVISVMTVRSFGAPAFPQVMGMLMPPLVVANAVAPVIAGWTRDLTGSYSVVFTYCGVLMLLSGLAVVTLRPIAQSPATDQLLLTRPRDA